MGEKGDMGCDETLREVERYVDGERLRELTVQVEAHLAGCSDCNDHAEFKKHMKVLIATKCRGEVLPRDWLSIRELIRTATPSGTALAASPVARLASVRNASTSRTSERSSVFSASGRRHLPVRRADGRRRRWRPASGGRRRHARRGRVDGRGAMAARVDGRVRTNELPWSLDVLGVKEHHFLEGPIDIDMDTGLDTAGAEQVRRIMRTSIRHRLHVRARGDDDTSPIRTCPAGPAKRSTRSRNPSPPVPRRLPEELRGGVAREARAFRHLPARHAQRRGGRRDRSRSRRRGSSSTRRSRRSRSTRADEALYEVFGDEGFRRFMAKEAFVLAATKGRDGRAARARSRSRLGSEARERSLTGSPTSTKSCSPGSAISRLRGLGGPGGPRRRRDPRSRRADARARDPRIPGR